MTDSANISVGLEFEKDTNKAWILISCSNGMSTCAVCLTPQVAETISDQIWDLAQLVNKHETYT